MRAGPFGWCSPAGRRADRNWSNDSVKRSMNSRPRLGMRANKKKSKEGADVARVTPNQMLIATRLENERPRLAKLFFLLLLEPDATKLRPKA